MPVKIYSHKITLIGADGVGKSNLMSRLVSDTYHENISQTVGTNINKKSFVFGDNNVSLSIWDTSGQKRYEHFFRTYIEKASAILICVDPTTKYFSKNKISDYIEKAKQYAPGAEIFFVVMKVETFVDAEGAALEVEDKEKFEVIRNHLIKQCSENSMDKENIFLTSAKTGYNVSEAFSSISEKLLNKVSLTDSKVAVPSNITRTLYDRMKGYLQDEIYRSPMKMRTFLPSLRGTK